MSDPISHGRSRPSIRGFLHFMASFTVGATKGQVVQLINWSSRPERLIALSHELGSVASKLPKHMLQPG
jgi:hypothetical protein